MPQGSTRDLSDRHDQMRVEIQTPKSPWTQNLPPKTSMPNFRDLKFPESIKWYNTKNINIRNWMCTLFAQLPRAGIRGHETTNLNRLFRIPKKSLHLNQTTQKNTCQIILPKTFRNRTFQTQEHPSIIVVNRHLKSGVPALPPPPRESRNHRFYYFPLVIILRRSCQRKSNPRRHDIYNAILKYKWVLFLYLFASVKCLCNNMPKGLPFTDGHKIITVEWL